MKQPVNLTSMGFGVQPIGVTKASALRNKKKFIRWLNQNHPKLLKDALDKANATRADVGLSGMNAASSGNSTDSQSSWYDKILNALPSVVSGYTAIKQQQQLIELNKKRAQQGLPPLNNPPAINVQGEAGPKTRAALQQSIKDAASQYVPYVAAGIGLIFLLNSRRRRR